MRSEEGDAFDPVGGCTSSSEVFMAAMGVVEKGEVRHRVYAMQSQHGHSMTHIQQDCQWALPDFEPIAGCVVELSLRSMPAIKDRVWIV